jgi:glycosyltransferase involved in cell wall biosynthesis
LEALDNQTLPKDQWELLLIDNASMELLREKWSLSWHPNARHIREEELGLTPARMRGIFESTGEILVFVDDDNILEKNYLKISFELAQEHPYLGVFGSARILPEFEIAPEADLEPYLPVLALRDVERAVWSNDPLDGNVPWGAGMVVLRKTADSHRERVLGSDMSRGLDRKGSQLNSCGDDEFSWTACEMGCGRGIFPELVVTHLISKSRLDRDYLYRLAEGTAFSTALLRWSKAGIMPYRNSESTVGMILSGLVRGKLIGAARHFVNLLEKIRMPEVKRQMIAARRKGIDRAIIYIKNAATE